MDNFQQFIAVSRYSRWMDTEARRETWDETVDRWWNYFSAILPTLPAQA